MRRGGNAVDAAIATAITLTVVEPCSNGLGSDAFAIVWDGQKLHGLNASGRSPRRWSRQRFQSLKAMPLMGWDSVTVPGAVSAWSVLSRRFGKLPFKDLFESAIYYATNGFHVGRRTAFHWQRAANRLGQFQGFRDHFLIDGRAPTTGENFKRPDLARSLEAIAATGGESFYRGELADTIVNQCEQEGGLLDREDLASHEPSWCEPLAQPYGDITLNEIPPNGQGLAALIALGVYEQLKAAYPHRNEAEDFHLQIEAMKGSIHISFQQFSDPDCMNVDPKNLLNESFLSQIANSISISAANRTPRVPSVGSDTVYLATADESGMMVSFIQSNYMGFGSGIVIKDTGISLQNRGAGFVLDKNHPNEVAGGKQPFHTIIPGFVTRSHEPVLAFGVMGGHMQHQGHLQMVTRIFDHSENPQAAADAPRWHVTPNLDVYLETGFPINIADSLRSLGHNVQYSNNIDLFGGAQLIYRWDDGYCAASDHRKEGLAGGF